MNQRETIKHTNILIDYQYPETTTYKYMHH